MLIRVVNPNTTASMTRAIEKAAAGAVSGGVRVEAVTPSMGPASIESAYDEALAVPGVLEQVAAGEAAGAAGHVIACFGDPGLDAARELASGPVVGIAEAAMRTAILLGRRFTVVTTLARTAGRALDLAARYVPAGACAGVRACELPVLALQDPTADVVDVLVAQCRAAVEVDGADVVVAGCAGMAGLVPVLARASGVPVVDGVAAATGLVELLVRLSLHPRAQGERARPPGKPYTGLLAGFALP